MANFPILCIQNLYFFLALKLIFRMNHLGLLLQERHLKLFLNLKNWIYHGTVI